jgi:hypothetical protein
MASVKKAQLGKAVTKKPASKDSVPSEMFPGKNVAKKDVRKGPYITETKKVVAKKKMKDGGKSFPDLNKDGKITQADILKGRGVIKNGGKMKKAKSGATLSPSKQSVSDELGGYKKVIGKNYSGKAKSGASVKKKAMGGMKMMKGGGKCKYGC